MASRGATKGISLIKRGWHEIPEVVGSIAMCALGLASFGIGAAVYLRDSDSAHQHRYTYTVVRTSDVDPNKKIYN